MGDTEFKPSISEEHGLALIRDSDLVILSAGISTGGAAEIGIAEAHPLAQVIATTIDTVGLEEAKQIIADRGLGERITTKLEDLRTDWSYVENYFDFIYARLVLHYLSAQDLDIVLQNFFRSLKPGERLFAVVRSVKNYEVESFVKMAYDEHTHLTTYRRAHDAEEDGWKRYFHTPETIQGHLKKAGFKILHVEEYEEQLYRDFLRTKPGKDKDHLIEVLATKPTS